MVVYEKHVVRLRRRDQGARGPARGLYRRHRVARRVLRPRRPDPCRADVVEAFRLNSCDCHSGRRRFTSLTAGAALIALVSAVSLRASAQPPAAAPAPLSFNRDIRPILANNCFACHGPDEKKRETDFHFDTKEGMFLEEGIVVPGSAAKSVLVKKITEPDPKDRMPPPDSGHALTDAQIALLKRWIDEGARWDTHWAYTAPSGPELPAVRQAQWVRNPIDQFILARLEREGLQPSREADKTTLLRRLSYDLTGLAADAGRSRRVPRRQVPRRLREARGRAAGVAALRRADGDALARRGALRRHARLPHRQPARHVALARLGDQRLQPQPAVRSVRDRAARRRSAAGSRRATRRSPPASIATT